MQENDRYTFAEVKVFNTSEKMNRTPSNCFSSTVAAAVAAEAE